MRNGERALCCGNKLVKNQRYVLILHIWIGDILTMKVWSRLSSTGVLYHRDSIELWDRCRISKFKQLINFYSPRIHQRIYGVLMISRGMKVNKSDRIRLIFEVKFGGDSLQTSGKLQVNHLRSPITANCWLRPVKSKYFSYGHFRENTRKFS